MSADRFALLDLLTEYGARLDAGDYDHWLDLFAAECAYSVVPRENYDRGLPAALIYCDNRAVLRDRVREIGRAHV